MLLLLLGIAAVFLADAVTAPSTEAPCSRYILQQPVLNSSAMSVTSFAFNFDTTDDRSSGSARVDWSKRIFGKDAVYWNFRDGPRSVDSGNASRQNPLKYYGTIEKARIAADRAFNALRAAGFNSSDKEDRCSVEALGYARLTDQLRAKPFRGAADRGTAPSVGVATLHFPKIEEKYSAIMYCKYRALYSNFRDTFENDIDTHWAVVFLCSFPRNTKTTADRCSVLEAHFAAVEGDKGTPAVLKTHLHSGSIWNTEFLIQRNRNCGRVRNDDVAVCSVWPYSSSHSQKLKANDALLFEFLRYYSNLNIRIFAYDRDGMSIGRAAASGYAQAQQLGLSESARRSQQLQFERYIEYHDYTIQGLLAGGSQRKQRNVYFDNENATQYGLWGQDFDKELTYTHCRFEAKAHYGLKQVLVVDFDEFLYCKAKDKDLVRQSPSAAAQISIFQQLIQERWRESLALEQVMFGQTWIGSRAKPPHSKSVLSCVNQQVALAERRVRRRGKANEYSGRAPSLFDCFSSIKHITYIPFVKSLHLTHACPFTSMHHACSGCFGSVRHLCAKSEQSIRAYDCMCNAEVAHECRLVHLSLVEQNYHGHNEHDHLDAAGLSSELWHIANAD